MQKFQEDFRKTCNYREHEAEKFFVLGYKSFHHLPIEYYRKNAKYNTVFAVVRNPYKRTESLYKFYCNKHKHIKINFADFVTKLTSNESFY